MAALDWITIQGFKSLRNVERLELADINVIIGANGSGKSNFISAFSFLNHVREGRLAEYVKRAGGADEILHFGRQETDALHFHLSFANEVNQYSLTLVGNDRNGIVPLDENGYYWNKSIYSKPYVEAIASGELEAGISQSPNRNITSYVRSHLEKWRVYHFHDTSSDSPLKRTSDVNDNRFLRSDGSNLPSFLYMMQEKFPSNFKRILGSVKDVAPFFNSFNLSPLSLNEEKITLEWLEMGHDKYMSSSLLSDGTVRFIALATLLLQPKELAPSVILIDEPELGLHPYALSVLAGLIRYAAVTSQIIVSTQSAFFLDNFQPEEVLVADRVGGATVLNRLESETLSGWLETYSLGQLWEKAEIGGRPRSGSERR